MRKNYFLLLFLFILAFGLSGNAQITAPGATNSVMTTYTNGATNDPIFIFCSPNAVGQNVTGRLSITGSGGPGPFTFNWFNYNLATNSWVPLTTQNGASSTLSNLPSGGYRVAVIDAGGTPRGCSRAWVWVKQTTVDVASIPPGCNPFSLSGAITTSDSYTYYNPPPNPFIIGPGTTITVCFRANHTYVSDLGFYLVGPPSCGSPFLPLAPHPQYINSAFGCCCNAGNNVNSLCFSTTANNMLQVCGAGTPLTGTYGIYGQGTPNNYNTNNNNWSPLYGCDATQGGWRVQVFDCVAQDVGALTNATITFSGNSSCGPSTITYNSGNINSVISDNSCSQGSASIYTVPNPVAQAITLNSVSNYQWSSSPAAGIANPTGTLTPAVSPVPTVDTWFYLTSTNSLGCIHKDSAFFDYYPNPAPVITPVGPFCTDAAAINLVANNPGGVWSGNGITNTATGTFNPATAGAGTHVISYITPLPCGDTATTSIVVNPLPVLIFNPVNPVFCAGLSVSVTASGANTYAWTPGAGLSATTGATVTANPVATTPYTVTGTSINGCVSSSVVTVTVNPLPVIVINPPLPTICNGSSINLIAAGANTYAWSPSTALSATTGAIVTAAPTTTTAYTVTGTDVLGCVNTGTTSVVVNQLPPVSVFPGSTAICIGNSAVLTASGANTYAWSPAAGLSATTGASVSANPLITTTYTITGTDINGCINTTSVTVTVNNLPPVTLNPVNPAICIGSSVNLIAAGANTYAWSPGAGLSATTGATVSANPVATTLYTVTGTDINGCFFAATTSVTVNPLPVITVTPPVPSLCNGSSILLTAGGANTYTWSPSTALSATTGTSVTANPTSLTFYTITGTDLNGCVDSYTFTVIVTTAVTATVNISDPLCNGSSDGIAFAAVTSGSSPFTYLWSDGQTTNPAVALPDGNINVTITDFVSCIGTASGTLTEPTAVSSTVAAFVFQGGDNISCNGLTDGSADLTVSGGTTPYTFLWSNGQTTEDLSNAPAGNYTVTITDANNCVSTNSVTLTEPPVLTVTLNSPTVVGGFNISCTGYNDGTVNPTLTNGVTPFSYLWSNGATTQNITNGIAGNTSLTITDVNGCAASNTIILTEPAGMTSSVIPVTYNGGFNISCNAATDGSIDLTVVNAAGAITYVWSNGAITQDISNLPAGNYSVVATDENGCTYASAATLTQPAILAGSLTPFTFNGNVNISCNGFSDGSVNSIITGGTLPYSYSWSNGPATQNISNVTAGNYSVTVTDANGCTLNLTATLTEPVALATTIFTSSLTTGGDNISCNGGADGAIDVTVSDGTFPYTFLWSNGATAEDIYNIPAGNYSVTVTDDNGCIAANNIVLTEPAALTLTITAFTDVLCNGGNDGSATALAAGGTTPYIYLWETGQTTSTITNFVAGIHTLTVTDNAGCDTTVTATISQPLVLSASVSGSNVICIGQNTQVSVVPAGGTVPYTYNWVPSPADPSLIPTDQSPTISPVVSTTYTLTITDANGCVLVADPLSVPVNPPLALTLSYNGPPGVCPGASTSINCIPSGGNGNYSWTVNSVPGNYSMPYTATPVATGYYVFILNDNCGTPVAVDSILVTLYPLPVVDFMADSLSGCEPFPVRFTDNTVPTPTAFLWNFGDTHSSTSTSPSNTYYQSGIYDVQLIATTSDGCVDSLTINNMIEVFPLPTADFTLSPTIVNVLEAWISFNDQSSGAHSWSWDFGDDSTSTLINPVHFYTDTGRYRIWLTVVSPEGCLDSIQREVRITPDFMIYVPNAFTPDENGLNDGFGVHGEGIKEDGFEFRIFTRWGEQIFSTFEVNGQWYGDYNGNGKPVEPGVYVYTVQLKNIHNKILAYKGHVVVLR